MRLRLSVQRNSLPATNILWSVPDTNSSQAYTIARLLEDVNQVLPLEAEQWGLEDYTVEVGGFECLHFSPVFQSLKDDDHVSIRPLLTAEVRSRTLCGRHQISEDGRHLVDGIPFGRPYLRQPHRPAVRIPPRKRRRIEEDTEPEHAEAGFIEIAEPEPLRITNGSANSPRDSQTRNGKADRTVRFTQPELDELDDSDEEEDEDFAAGSESDSDDSMDSDTDSEAESKSTASPAADSADSSDDSESDSDSDSDSDSSSSDDSESISSAPDVLSSKPPGSGTSTTKFRNRRRVHSEKLKRLKKEGLLHPDANFEDLRRYEGELREHRKSQGQDTECDQTEPARKPAHPMSSSTGKRKRYHGETTAEDTEFTPALSELEQRRNQLMASLENGTMSRSETPRTATPRAATPIATPEVTESPQVGDSRKEIPNATPEKRPSESKAEASPARKRLRPDTNAIARILKHQTKNTEKKAARQKAPIEKTPEPEGANDPEFWKSRINLSAFECWEEEFELSAPPFPFVQHWDPASKLMREKLNKTRNKKNKKREREATPEAQEEPPLILDYDDPPETPKPDSDPTTAAIESQLMQDVQVAAQSDLPPLPDDVAALPELDSRDIQVGAIIVFKRWTLDAKTVTPLISSYMTAIVEKEGDSGAGAGTFRLKFAARDVPKVEEVDANGERVMTARDGFRMDIDGEEDESIWDCTFQELIGPKLLKGAE